MEGPGRHHGKRRFVAEFFRARPDDVPYLNRVLDIRFVRFKISRVYGTPNTMPEAREMAGIEDLARLLSLGDQDLPEIDKLMSVVRKSKEAGTKRSARAYLRRFTADENVFASNAMGRILASIAGPAALADLVQAANGSPDRTSTDLAPLVEAIRSVLFKKRYVAKSVLYDLAASPHQELRDLVGRTEQFLGHQVTEAGRGRKPHRRYRLPDPLPDPI